MADSDGFQFISHKRGRKKGNTAQILPTGTEQNRDIEDLGYVQRRLEQCLVEIESCPAVGRLVLAIKDIISNQDSACSRKKPFRTELIGYGIGPFASSLPAKYHLAMLLHLRKSLNVSECLVYDPVWVSVENDILLKSDCNLIPHNEEGKRTVCQDKDTMSIFFMPHCGKALYNNLLWTNWKSTSLCRTLLIGNSFSEMALSMPDQVLKSSYMYISRVLPYTTIIDVDKSELPEEVLSSTALHVFSDKLLQTIPEDIWLQTQEPLYEDDVEIIQNIQLK